MGAMSAVTAAVASLRALAEPYRLRVVKDAEGYPVIPGRLGRVEYHDGTQFAVYSDRPRLFARLWAIPGVRRWQTGDGEMRALFPVDALEVVARALRARRRRPPGSAAHLRKAA